MAGSLAEWGWMCQGDTAVFVKNAGEVGVFFGWFVGWRGGKGNGRVRLHACLTTD